MVHNTVASIGYNITQISMSTHQGTHLDVPYHFLDDGKTIDQMPLDRFYGPAVLMDLAPGSFLPAKTPITPAMFAPTPTNPARGQGDLPDRLGPGVRDARVLFRFSLADLEAARWIADRRIGLLGMDTPTPGTEWKEVHWTLLAQGVEIVIVEGLTGLEQLPRTVHALGVPAEHQGPRRQTLPRRGDR